MPVAMPRTVGPKARGDRIGRLARAALKQALGVVTGDRRLEAEGAAERSAEAACDGAAAAGHAAGIPAEGRDAR